MIRRSHDMSPRVTTRHLGVAALVATAALVAGCGNATKSLSAPAASVVPPAASAPATAATATDAAPAASDAASPAVSASDAPAASAPAGTAVGSKFCMIAQAEQDQSKQLATQLTSATPDSLKAFIMKAVDALPAFAAAAPDSIKADVQKLVDIDNKLFGALKANNYDFTKSASAVQAAISDPSFATAGAHVTSYLMSGCGLSASLPAASPSS